MKNYTYDDYLEEMFGEPELQRHKAGDRVKWVLTLIAFILIGVMLVGIIFGWFDKLLEKPAEEEQQEPTANAVVDVTESHGIVLASAGIPQTLYSEYGISAQAENAFTLTAKVQPVNADNTNVAWSVAFVNPSSSWANGKQASDYIFITAIGKTATVACLQPFGEKIKVRVASEENAEIFAECTCEYVKRLSNFTFTPAVINFGNTSYTQVADFGVGTITPTLTVKITKVVLDDTFANRVKTNFSSEGCSYPYRFDTDWWFNSGNTAEYIKINEANKTFSKEYSSDFQTWFTYMDETDYSSSELNELAGCINRAFRLATKNYTGKQGTMTVQYTVTYNNVTYNSETVSVPVTFDGVSNAVSVTGVEMEDGVPSTLIY